jgi:TolA-binding protein
MKARDVFEKAAADFPCSPVIDLTMFHLAAACMKENEWQKAFDAFRSMLDEYPETRRHPESLYHMGICLLNLGRSAEAGLYFEKIPSEFPEDEWADFARARLKELNPGYSGGD